MLSDDEFESVQDHVININDDARIQHQQVLMDLGEYPC